MNSFRLAFANVYSRPRKTFVGFAAAAALSVSAQTFGQSAHEHGAGQLNIVAADNELLIELVVPAVNAVGFENTPRTDAEHARVRETIKTFEAAKSLFQPSAAADCHLESANVKVGQLDDDHDEAKHGKDKHGDKKHAKDKHDDHAHGDKKHAKDKHDDHAHGDKKHAKDEHGHDAHDRKDDDHSSLLATYEYHCDAPDALKAVALTLFEHLKDMSHLRTAVVADSSQTLVRVTQKTKTITLRR